jgi:excisionase family DNA binding protein
MSRELGLPSQKFGYTLTEVVALTGLSRSQLYQERKVGRLKVIKVGRRALIAHEDLVAWFETLRRAA